MGNQTDHELLAEFVGNDSESAFAALVARYVNLVYSTALRHTNNSHHAEEVTQAVFIILAHKAGRISSKVVLSGWLYQAARLTAANHRRANQRRQQREQQAIMESALNVPADESWKLIAPVLDEAMNALGMTDRDAVVLRYFENKPLAEVGAALGVSEAAAEKRVSRALERLRGLLVKHGVVLGGTAIAGAVTTNAVQSAPATLAASITVAALSATGLTTTAVVMTTLQKIAVAAVLTITIGGGIYATKRASDARKEVLELQAQQAPMAEEMRELQTSLTEASNRLTSLMVENAELKSANDKTEVLKLRGEVASMRTQLADLESHRGTNAVAGLVVRSYRLDLNGFLEKAESALGHPASRTPVQIVTDYFASNDINLEPPKSVYLNTSRATLMVRATELEQEAIEKLLAGSIPQRQMHIRARFIEIPRQGFVMPPALWAVNNNEPSTVTGILSPSQVQDMYKLLEQKEGFKALAESGVVTLSGRECQIGTGGDGEAGQTAKPEAMVDVVAELLADGFTIKLKVNVNAPESVVGEANLYDHQTLILTAPEKSKPDTLLIVFVIPTVIDAAGNRYHGDEEMPFANVGPPPQN